jgi:putative (di)nucleoside polyphosphate hydrolase
MSSKPKKQSQFFRAGVGIIVADAKGRVLALRRADVPGEAWQLPQGGLDAGEEPEATMWRELEEETGLNRENCEYLAESDGWLAYELPENFRTAKVGRGQVQRWYLCRFTGEDSEITPDGREFDAWKWFDFEALAESTAPFRRGVYRALAGEFGAYLS